MYPTEEDIPLVAEPESNYITGYIKLYRSFKNHWLWKDSTEKSFVEAWIDLLMRANHQDNKEAFGYDLIILRRGQLLTSQMQLAIDWRWTRKRVLKFLQMLKSDNMINIETSTKWSKITICKYDSYQSFGTAKGQQRDNRGTTKGQQGYTNNNANNSNNDKNDKNINIPFDDFWNLYDKKKGEKTKLEKKWKSLKDEDRIAIIDYLPAYIKSTPDKTFRKDPYTFLNNSSWHDEILGYSPRKTNYDPENPDNKW